MGWCSELSIGLIPHFIVLLQQVFTPSIGVERLAMRWRVGIELRVCAIT
jgi:hypothetical protein